MEDNLRQRYYLNRSEVRNSFEKQMGLKMNPDYEKWGNEKAVALIEYFINKYKGVKIEIPKLREKSPRSLMGKIKNLQIERLSKLYALNKMPEKNGQDLYDLIEERINENENLDAERTLNTVKDLIYDEAINIDTFEKYLMVDGISNSTKTALLRMLVGKIERSDVANKQSELKYLDEKYGRRRAEETGNIEDDLIRYSSIENLKNNPDKVERLQDETQFLKANDLRGMKIIATYIPDDFETDNEEIKRFIKLRNSTDDKAKQREYNRLAIVELGKEFYNDLENDEEFLNKNGIRVIPDSSRHKKKINGYEAEHVKFISMDEPEYTLEMQFKSEYVENITRGNGSASHENRPGKSRVLPHADNDADLKKKLKYMVPQYTIFKMVNGKVVPQKQNMLRNVISYFQDQIDVDSEEYDKIYELFSNEEQDKSI